MSFLYLHAAANHLLSGNPTFNASSEDSLFPWANLSDGRLWYEGRFDAAGADDYVEADFGYTSVTADFVSFHGLAADDGIGVELRRGSGGSTLVATLTRQETSFYAQFASVADTLWRLRFTGTNSVPIRLCKAALGEVSSLTRMQDAQWTVDRLMPQLRGPGQTPVNLADFDRGVLSLAWRLLTQDQRAEVLALCRDSSYGEDPLVIVPDNADPLWSLWARSPNRVQIQAISHLASDTLGGWTTSLVFEEDDFPEASQ